MDVEVDISFFEKNGYFVIRNIFPHADTTAFKNVLLECLKFFYKKTVGTFEHDFDKLFADLLTRSPESISVIQRIISREPSYYKLVSNINLAKALKFFLGLNENEPTYLISNGIIFSSKDTLFRSRSANMKVDWHNDIYFTIPKSPFIQMWAPLLTDATMENGTLMIAVGSHKKNILAQNFNETAPYIHRYTISENDIKEFKKLSVEVKLGDILIFDGRLIHASGTNNTNSPRCTMIGVAHNPKSEAFLPTLIDYKYQHQTPEEYYFENNPNNEKILPYLKEQALESEEVPGGV